MIELPGALRAQLLAGTKVICQRVAPDFDAGQLRDAWAATLPTSGIKLVSDVAPVPKTSPLLGLPLLRDFDILIRALPDDPRRPALEF